jgi:hypothetical protein
VIIDLGLEKYSAYGGISVRYEIENRMKKRGEHVGYSTKFWW